MELKTFIKDTILEIVEGVLLSQTEITSKYPDVLINPPNPFESAIVRKNKAPDPRDLSKIVFDVLIESKVINNKGIEFSAIQVVSGGFDKSNQNLTSNRVKFSIPVSLPECKV